MSWFCFKNATIVAFILSIFSPFFWQVSANPNVFEEYSLNGIKNHLRSQITLLEQDQHLSDEQKIKLLSHQSSLSEQLDSLQNLKNQGFSYSEDFINFLSKAD